MSCRDVQQHMCDSTFTKVSFDLPSIQADCLSAALEVCSSAHDSATAFQDARECSLTQLVLCLART